MQWIHHCSSSEYTEDFLIMNPMWTLSGKCGMLQRMEYNIGHSAKAFRKSSWTHWELGSDICAAWSHSGTYCCCCCCFLLLFFRLSPELHLHRPVTDGNKWRLDQILKRKAVSQVTWLTLDRHTDSETDRQLWLFGVYLHFTSTFIISFLFIPFFSFSDFFPLLYLFCSFLFFLLLSFPWSFQSFTLRLSVWIPVLLVLFLEGKWC